MTAVTLARLSDVTSAVLGAHGARVKRSSSNFSIGNNTYTVVEFDAEDYDTDTMHDNSTNPGRLTIPTLAGVTTGLWSIEASGYVTGFAGSAARVDAVIRLGGSTAIGFASNNDGAIGTFKVSCDYVFSAAQYVELQLKLASASGAAVHDPGISPLFEIAFLGKVT